MVDLIVVGAGPAGCAAAIWAATCGLRVQLLDRPRRARSRPGECLHPGAEGPLRQLGVLERVRAHCSIAPSLRAIVIHGNRAEQPFGADDAGPWRAFHIFRADLDAILLARARELGVCFRTCRSVRLLPARGEARAFEIDGAEFHAVYVIDASGQAGWLTRSLGLRARAASPRLTAHYGYMQGEAADDQLFAADGAGWTWMARVDPQIVAWTALRFESHCLPPLPDTLAAMRKREPLRGADATWRIAPSVAGPGYYVVGDAAFVTDPASGNGVLRAIMSGMKAAHHVAAVLGGRATGRDAAHEFRQWIEQWFEADTGRLADLYDQLQPNWRRDMSRRTIAPAKPSFSSSDHRPYQLAGAF